MADSTPMVSLSCLPEIDEGKDMPSPVEKGPWKVLWTAAFLTPVILAQPMDLSDQELALKAATVVEEEEKADEFAQSFFARTPFHEQEPYVSVAEAENRTRLELLARQYVASKLSPEEEARLAIASERVRRLIPRVTAKDFQVLEEILEDAERIELADIERRRRLGIE